MMAFVSPFFTFVLLFSAVHFSQQNKADKIVARSRRYMMVQDDNDGCNNGYRNENGTCTCYDIWLRPDCKEHKCRNKGYPDSAGKGKEGQKCICVDPYYGSYCEKHRCNNRGTFDDKYLQTHCLCDTGYSGANCNECDNGYRMEGVVCVTAPKDWMLIGHDENNFRDDEDAFNWTPVYAIGGALVLMVALACFVRSIQVYKRKSSTSTSCTPSPNGNGSPTDPTAPAYPEHTHGLLAGGMAPSAPPKHDVISIGEAPPSYEQAAQL